MDLLPQKLDEIGPGILPAVSVGAGGFSRALVDAHERHLPERDAAFLHAQLIRYAIQ